MAGGIFLGSIVKSCNSVILPKSQLNCKIQMSTTEQKNRFEIIKVGDRYKVVDHVNNKEVIPPCDIDLAGLYSYYKTSPNKASQADQLLADVLDNKFPVTSLKNNVAKHYPRLVGIIA